MNLLHTVIEDGEKILLVKRIKRNVTMIIGAGRFQNRRTRLLFLILHRRHEMDPFPPGKLSISMADLSDYVDTTEGPRLGENINTF